MKKLYAPDGIYEADKIVKTENSIVGYIEGKDTPEFTFKGIKDWSQFRLEEGQKWDMDEEAAEAAFLLDLDYRISLLELGVV